ncbi:hypothetical protein ACX64N_12750 [Raoultella planticola]
MNASAIRKMVVTALVGHTDVDNCETNNKTLKQLRDAYNEHDHEVKGVEQGNDAVTSEKPGEQV